MADIDAPLAWRMQQDGYLMQINQLRDENTKLRGQYEAVIDDYRSEVAKLRELCGYLLPFAESCGAEHPLIHELGIEVD